MFLVFPVMVKDNVVKSREDGHAVVIEAANYEEAHTIGSNKIPLFEGEQLAVVVIGKKQ